MGMMDAWRSRLRSISSRRRSSGTLSGSIYLRITLGCDAEWRAEMSAFHHRGFLSTEQRTGDYAHHGWNSEGHAWTEWRRASARTWVDPAKRALVF
jgi:hypothetical protein